MANIVTPATLVFDASGTPFSTLYGDVYHSRAGGLAQAREVFLAGSDLPARWGGRRVFTILETGLGLATNFLATWAAWQADALRCGRLHYVAIEKHPFSAADLLVWHGRDAATLPLASALAAQWPEPTPGLHRVELEGGKVVLTLALGDFADILPKLRLAANAFYLDGFAPSRNPDAWDTAVFQGIARLAVPGATVATYTVARAVADGLAAAGFEVEKAQGFGGKRDKLVGHYAPRYRMRRNEPPAQAIWRERRALVVGAGVAGVAAAAGLAARGWQVQVLDQAGVARGASSTPAGAIHPVLSRDDNLLARLTRAGFLRMRASLARLVPGGCDWLSLCGHLDCAADAAEEARLTDVITGLGFPAAFATAVDSATASDIAGTRVARGGYWFPGGAWLKASAWCNAMLAAWPQIELGVGGGVASLVREKGAWIARDGGGVELARAPVAVLAAGIGLAELAGTPLLPLQLVRGQLTGVAARDCRPPRAVVGGDGYCLPPIDGMVWTGASYGPDDTETRMRDAEQENNLRQLSQLLPENDFAGRRLELASHVGFRSVAPDRMPLVGALPDLPAVASLPGQRGGPHLIDLPRQLGLYVAGGMASRGLTWSALAGETLADLIEGEPPPLESDLLDAIDPARFLLRQMRGR